MNDFDALLKRSFAEAPEPVDDGFTAAITQRVARTEKLAQSRFGFQMAALGIAVVAVAYGLWGMLAGMAPDLAATAGLELARAHGALSGGTPVSLTGMAQSMGAGLTQVLLVSAALAGGAVAFRNAQE
jgi:hypothetical protein